MFLVEPINEIDHKDRFIRDVKQVILAKNAPKLAFLAPNSIFRPPLKHFQTCNIILNYLCHKFSWFKPGQEVFQKRVFLPCILKFSSYWLRMTKMCVSQVQICSTSKNVLHQECDNVLKVFLECFSRVKSTISAPETV